VFINFVLDINFLFIQENGFSQPFLVKDVSTLNLRYTVFAVITFYVLLILQ